jgi:predicted TPR repeat methyltransferase
MNEYTAFAYIYDEFMDNIPYEESVSYLHDLLVENGVDKGTIVELGCGTGRITRMLAGLGYDMVGIDISEDMLTQAGSTEYADGESNDVSDSKCSGSIIYSLQDEGVCCSV